MTLRALSDRSNVASPPSPARSYFPRDSLPRQVGQVIIVTCHTSHSCKFSLLFCKVVVEAGGVRTSCISQNPLQVVGITLTDIIPGGSGAFGCFLKVWYRPRKETMFYALLSSRYYSRISKEMQSFFKQYKPPFSSECG